MVNTNLPRIASDVAALDSGVDGAATSIPLDTASWTVDPDQYPMLVNINGEIVRAGGASISGTVTLTSVTRAVNNVAKAHSAGTAVEVADPLRVTLGRRGEGLVSVASPPPAASGISQTDLVVWIDAAQDDTAANLADDDTYTAQLGSTAGADSEDPTITTNDGRDVWSPDGTGDYIEIDYQPTITATTGELTVIFVGVYDANDTTENYSRWFSTETGNTNGFVINSGDPGDTEASIALGGATTSVGAFNTSPGFVNGQAFMVAGVFDDGDLRIYVPGAGLSDATDTSGVGTITHESVSRVFHPANDTLADREASSDCQALLIYERALTETQLNDVAAYYDLSASTGAGATYYGGDYRPAAPSPLRTRSATPATFDSVIGTALPGDRIELATGSYGEWDITSGGVNGTASNPIVITPAAGATATFVEIDIRENCSHVWMGQFNGEPQHTQFVIDRSGGGGGGGACLRIGWDQQRSGSHAQDTVDNLKFCGIHITDVGFNPCVIKGGASDIDILNCRFSLGGQSQPWYGEHIYIGQASPSLSSANERILVQGNKFEGGTADVVDIKMSNVQDIQVLDNYFEIAVFDGTGAGFTNGAVGITQLQAQQVRDPEIKVLRNVFRDISETGTDALARAVTTYMPCEIAYNIAFRTGREAVRCNQNATLPGWWTTDIKFNIHHNTFFDTDEDANGVAAVTFSGFDTDDAARLRYVSNVTDSAVTVPAGTAEESDNHVATVSDFVGPTAGSANAGAHVGSGYQVAEGSSIPATAGALGKASTPGSSGFTIVGSGELAYNSGTTFTVPAGIADGDVLLVAVSEAGSAGDPGAPSASLPTSGALTSIYSDWPGAGSFEPRQSLLGLVLTAADDASDLCTVTPGSAQESIGWVVVRGLSGLPGSKQQAFGTGTGGIDFPSIAASADDFLFLHGSDQETVSTAADASTLDITVLEILTQMSNNRGQWFAIYEVPATTTVDPGTLSKSGGGSYQNWVGTVTLATP